MSLRTDKLRHHPGQSRRGNERSPAFGRSLAASGVTVASTGSMATNKRLDCRDADPVLVSSAVVTASNDIRIRRIQASEGLILRELRLRSLADAPEAFGQPVIEARARPDADWQRSARQSAHGDTHTWLFAERHGTVVGLVQGRKRHPDTLLLFSMWVDPGCRRLGVGRALIEALEGWALTRWSAQDTLLWVYEGNTAAIEFYRDLGFRTLRTGDDAESGARFGALAMQRGIADSRLRARP